MTDATPELTGSTDPDVLAALSEFYTPEGVATWLNAPHRLLGGRTAAALIAEGNKDEVLRLLGQMRDGVYL